MLAGDLGGTKARLGLFARTGAVRPLVEARLASREFPQVAALLRAFLRAHPAHVTAACFGVAGPVLDGRCRGANLPWTVDATALARTFGWRSVTLLNDLAATAHGIRALPPRAFTVLQAGRAEPRGAVAVIAAGTGLGESAMLWTGGGWQAMPTEGGHADFAPRTRQEVALWQSLARRYGHVSVERVLSGPGKVAIYEFLRATGRVREPRWLRRALAAGDRSAVISELAVTNRSALCRRALEQFVSVYGAEAGNLALRTLATGGVYLGGGIAPTIVPLLRRGGFLRAFRDKGRLRPLLRRIPVRVILDDRAALYGAAAVARRMMRSG